MDYLICNKCMTTICRGKRPYFLSQCGHVFCQECVVQAEKQCPQCEYIGALSIPLQEPLQSKVAYLFSPLSDALERLEKTETFRNNQMKITMQRFLDIDKKYEMLKSHYWNMVDKMKILTEKYYKLKKEKEAVENKLMFLKTHHSPMNSSGMMSTPNPRLKYAMPYSPTLGTRDSGYTAHSAFSSFRSVNTIAQPSKTPNKYMTSDGFRIPNICRPPKSAGSCSNSDTSPTYINITGIQRQKLMPFNQNT